MLRLSRADELVRGLATIAILEDDDFKRGIYDQIDGRAATHFLISPFLGLLGYNVFKMNEIRFGYAVEGVEADVALFDNGGVLAAFRVLALSDKNRFEVDAEEFVTDASKGLSLGKIGAPLVVLTNGLDYRLYTIKEDSVELLNAFDLYDLRRADTKTLEFVLSLLDRRSLVGAIDRPLFFNELLVKSKVGVLWQTDYVREALAKVLANPSEFLMDEIAQAIIAEHYDDKSDTQLVDDLVSEYAREPFNLADLIAVGDTVAVPVATTETETGTTVQEPVEALVEEIAEEVDAVVEAATSDVSVDEAVVEPDRVEEDVEEEVVEEDAAKEESSVATVRPYGYATYGDDDDVDGVADTTNDSETPARTEDTVRRDPLAAWANVSKPQTSSEYDLDLGDDEEEIELEDTPDTDPKNGVDLKNLLGL